MTESNRSDEPRQDPGRTNWTMIALIGALLILALMVLYLATRGNADQDKLTNRVVDTGRPALGNDDKLCASSASYDLIKRELFRRAAQLRGSDQAAFDRLAAAAVVRMENPVMEGQDAATRAVKCSGSLNLDLPPGVQVVGGRRTLSSDIDYTVTMAADGTGPVVLLQNADAIITPLATLAQVTPQAQQAPQQPGPANAAVPETNVASPQPPPEPAAPPAPPQPARVTRTRAHAQGTGPSFDCSKARSRGERAVCSDPGLAGLDRQMALQYARAFAAASPEERDVLRQTAHRFYAYRDHCATNACIAETYAGRIREIRDIVEGRWEPPQ